SGSATITGGSITNTTTNPTSAGVALYAEDAGSLLSITDATITTSGTSEGTHTPSYGVRGRHGATITITGGSVETTGNYAFGLGVVDDGTTLSASGVGVTTNGTQGIGVQAYASSNGTQSNSVTIE